MTPTTPNIEIVRTRQNEFARAAERGRRPRRPRQRRDRDTHLFVSKHLRLWRRRLQTA
jgi:hypothetical protein